MQLSWKQLYARRLSQRTRIEKLLTSRNPEPTGPALGRGLGVVRVVHQEVTVHIGPVVARRHANRPWGADACPRKFHHDDVQRVVDVVGRRALDTITSAVEHPALARPGPCARLDEQFPKDALGALDPDHVLRVFTGAPQVDEPLPDHDVLPVSYTHLT